MAVADAPEESDKIEPDKRIIGRDYSEENASHRLEIFLRRFPYLVEIAHRLQRGGKMRSSVILYRLMTLHGTAPSFWPFRRSNDPPPPAASQDEIRKPYDSN
jgi:hypothetical protein